MIITCLSQIAEANGNYVKNTASQGSANGSQGRASDGPEAPRFGQRWAVISCSTPPTAPLTGHTIFVPFWQLTLLPYTLNTPNTPSVAEERAMVP